MMKEDKELFEKEEMQDNRFQLNGGLDDDTDFQHKEKTKRWILVGVLIVCALVLMISYRYKKAEEEAKKQEELSVLKDHGWRDLYYLSFIDYQMNQMLIESYEDRISELESEVASLKKEVKSLDKELHPELYPQPTHDDPEVDNTNESPMDHSSTEPTKPTPYHSNLDDGHSTHEVELPEPM